MVCDFRVSDQLYLALLGQLAVLCLLLWVVFIFFHGRELLKGFPYFPGLKWDLSMLTFPLISIP